MNGNHHDRGYTVSLPYHWDEGWVVWGEHESSCGTTEHVAAYFSRVAAKQPEPLELEMA